MRAVLAAWQILCTVAFAVPFVPMYLAGACYEALRSGWRSGRADVRSMTD